MRGRSSKAARQADAQLADRELGLLLGTELDWKALRPDGVDAATYASLVGAVRRATARNESIVELRARLAQLGDAAVTAARLVAGRL